MRDKNATIESLLRKIVDLGSRLKSLSSRQISSLQDIDDNNTDDMVPIEVQYQLPDLRAVEEDSSSGGGGGIFGRFPGDENDDYIDYEQFGECDNSF